MNIIVFIFFFKQKTAYEMRISDWSSDVCSSDLRCKLPGEGVVNAILYEDPIGTHARLARIPKLGSNGSGNSCVQVRVVEHDERRVAAKRSEEHTSELQSLMRISYAVFCLKKKRHHQ